MSEVDMSNKGTDINVGIIEEYVKILNKFCEYENAVVLTDNALEEVQDSIENILAEREQKDKRIQELEVKLKCAKGLYDDCCNCLLNSIPKQVVIDKMEENKQILDKTNDGNLRERLYIENGILKELLERKK